MKIYIRIIILVIVLSLPAIKGENELFAQSFHHTEAAGKSVTGMTSGGGRKGYGVTYNYNSSNGKDSTLFSFGSSGGSVFLGSPMGNVTQASNGKIYGMGTFGGAFNYGGIFCYNPATGNDSIVLSFYGANGLYPYGSLMQASDGLLYGMTSSGGSKGSGVLFSFNPKANKDSVLINFDGLNGISPYGSVIQASDGLLYAMAGGGSKNGGVLFSFDPITGKDSIRINFDSAHGRYPSNSLIQASDGLLYGVTEGGGAYNKGTLFSFDPFSGKDSIRVNFDSLVGISLSGPLLQASDGLLYGMAGGGGAYNKGTLFSFNPVNNKDTVLVNFNGTNGAEPDNPLIQASDGLLYGIIFAGGSLGSGVLFSYNPKTAKENVLLSLTGLNGAFPQGNGIMQASNGMIYGMTYQGGTVGSGVFFRFNPITLQDTVLFNFTCSPSYLPLNNIIQASNGNLYGTTEWGGSSVDGTLFSYNSSTGKDSVLINFNWTNGSTPDGGLIQASDGLLYGLTSAGGSSSNGTLFSFNPFSNTENILVNFNGTNGYLPEGSLIQASDGWLYGMTFAGGTTGWGTIFSYDPGAGIYYVLVNFNETNGGKPQGSLIQAANGLLYGVASYGGVSGRGMLFSYDPSKGEYDTIFSLDTIAGAAPQGNVIVDTGAHLIYATSVYGGSNSDGTMFSYNMNSKTAKRIIDFNFTNGALPSGILLWDTAANYIYSTTYYGGAYNYGVLFRYDINTGKDSVLLNFNDTIGANPCGIMLVNNGVVWVDNLQAPKDLIIVYPNPVKDIATVLFGEEGKHFIEIDDMQGKKLRWISTADKQYTITRNGLASGMYLLKFYDGSEHYLSTSKIVVQ